jgi:hypothetical protein
MFVLSHSSKPAGSRTMSRTERGVLLYASKESVAGTRPANATGKARATVLFPIDMRFGNNACATYVLR